MSAHTAPTETVTLTIDGREVTVPKGTLVIRAAERLGTVIPRFCDHPLLDPVGACRQCIVEIEGQRKPMTACTTPCQDDMVVKTHLTSEMAKKAQEGQLELLLINHPLDCPMCDKGGECPLQDQALTHGANVSRFIDEKRKYVKPVAVSQQILLDRERCVLCARCTRFSNEIAGDPFIELFERGALEQVAIYEDEPYESYFSGNIIQICPVGALTSKSYRFKARPFDVKSGPSVCDHCSAGCTQTVQARRGEVQRQLARTNMAVNEMWNCDKGRFGFAHLTHETRLREPAVRKEGELVPVSWAESLTRVTEAVRDARQAGAGRVAVLTGSRLADEDAYAASKYARVVLGTDDVDFRTRAAGPDEDAALAAAVGRVNATYEDVEHAPVVLVVGLDPEEEVPILFLRLRKAWRNNGARIVPVGARAGSVATYAWRRLDTRPGRAGDALAAAGRALGAAGLAERSVDAGYQDPHLDDVVDALRDAGSDAVVLVGERGAAEPGALSAAGQLAEAVGAKLGWVPRRAGARGALDAGLAPGLLPGGRRLEDPDQAAELESRWGTDLPGAPGRSLHGILRAAADGEIDVLHLIGVDLARDCDAPELVRAALDRVGTVVVQDLARTETTALADVVLPASGTQERAGSYTNWEGRRQPFSPVVPAPQLAQTDWEILVQLAALAGVDLGFHDLDGLRAELQTLRGPVDPPAWPAPAVSGASDAEASGAQSGELELLTYPLLLDRGTMTVGADDLLATAPDPYVAVNPEDAERLGLADGAPATVAGAAATLTLPVRVEDDVVAGTVFVPANSTETPAHALTGTAGPVRVEIRAAGEGS